MAERSGEAVQRSFAFEMAVTRDELIRLAPHLDPAHPIAVDGDTVAGRFGAAGTGWSITLGARRERVIALMRFPIADVELRITDDDATAVDRFLARFHLVFRKGGG